MKLEQKVKELISKTNSTHFDIIAHELWGNSKDGFDCNSSWYLKRDADISEVMEAARGRWEVFKVNYLPKAKVKDIQDIGCDSSFFLEVDSVAFLDLIATN